MLVTLNVNGTLSELLVEPDALSWWRADANRQQQQQQQQQQHQHQGASPFRQLAKHLSSTSISQQTHHDDRESAHTPLERRQTTPSTIVTAPAIGDPSDSKHRGHHHHLANDAEAATAAGVRKLKRVDFNQIIGVEKVQARGERGPDQRGRKGDGSSHDNSQSEQSTITTTSASSERDGVGQPTISKLKVYFAQRRDHKSTGRLLKLRRLVIEMGRSKYSQTNGTSRRDSWSLGDLHDLIEQHLELKRRQRPKRLLIFVNPFGGKGKALQLFKRKVKRVLDLAQIESELVVTQYANHAREMLENVDFQLNHYDGIICVGGDGMFGELMNGLLFRYNRNKIKRAATSASSSSLSASHEMGATMQMAAPIPSSDLDSIDATSSSNSPSSGGSASASSATLDQQTALSDDILSDNKRTAQVIPEGNNSNNNNNNEDDEGIGELIKSKSLLAGGGGGGQVCGQNQSHGGEQSSLEQQMDQLRSSLGGIGERFYSPTIPIGVIGAGSTDANLFGFIGTNDAISATLNIVLGNQIQIDVCSIHSIQDDRLLRFVSTFVAYGFFGDVIRESEKLRWLGPSRYDITGLNTLIKYRNYKGLVRILSSPRDGTPRDSNRCHLNCSLCQNNISNSFSFNDLSHLSKSHHDDDNVDHIDNGANGDNHHPNHHPNQHRDHRRLTPVPKGFDDLNQFEIIERRGSFVGVNAAVTACRCPKTSKGFSPNNHLANGCADLILVRPCSRLSYINYLLRTGHTNKSAFDLKFVETFRCRQFEFIVERQQQQQQQQLGPHTESCGDAATGSQSPSSTSADENSTTSGYGSSSTIKQSSRESCSSTGDSNLSLPSSGRSNPQAHQRHAGTHRAETVMQKQQQRRRQQLQPDSSWNADGEILSEQSIRVKVNNKLLRVFGTGEPRRECAKLKSS